MRNIVTLLAIILLIIGCSKTETTATYFGGKIINPKKNYIVLGNHNGVVDTIMLKKDNTFLAKFDSIKSGLYYFQHGPELQYVFLEPKDSLLIRLNTWDFDESLVFSGVSADRNNALIQTYLQNEKDEKKFSKYYHLPFNKFLSKVNKLQEEKKVFLNEYKLENNETSEMFLDVLNVALTYPVHRKIETFSIYNAQRKKPKKISISEIIKRRTKINFTRDTLLMFPPYRSTFLNYVYNDICYVDDFYEFGTDDFTNAFLKQIDSKIKNAKQKNNFLLLAIVNDFYRKKNCRLTPKVMNTFLSLSTNEKDKKEIKALNKDVQKLTSNSVMQDFKVNSEQGERNISEIIENKSAAICFRNSLEASDDWLTSRLNFLIKKYPNITFSLVDIDNKYSKKIKPLNTKHQYYLEEDSSAHEFLTSKHSRTVLVDQNGIIKNGFASLSSKEIESDLQGLNEMAQTVSLLKP